MKRCDARHVTMLNLLRSANRALAFDVFDRAHKMVNIDIGSIGGCFCSCVHMCVCMWLCGKEKKPIQHDIEITPKPERKLLSCAMLLAPCRWEEDDPARHYRFVPKSMSLPQHHAWIISCSWKCTHTDTLSRKCLCMRHGTHGSHGHTTKKQ